MAGPLRPNPLPPQLSLMAVEILERWTKSFQQSSFFLKGPALYPPPLLMAQPLREESFLRLPLGVFSIRNMQNVFLHMFENELKKSEKVLHIITQVRCVGEREELSHTYIFYGAFQKGNHFVKKVVRFDDKIVKFSSVSKRKK